MGSGWPCSPGPLPGREPTLVCLTCAPKVKGSVIGQAQFHQRPRGALVLALRFQQGQRPTVEVDRLFVRVDQSGLVASVGQVRGCLTAISGLLPVIGQARYLFWCMRIDALDRLCHAPVQPRTLDLGQRIHGPFAQPVVGEAPLSSLHLQHGHVGTRRQPAVQVHLRTQRVEQVQVQVFSGDRRQLQEGACPFWHAVETALYEPPHPLGKDAGGQRHHPNQVQLSRLLGEGAHRLHQEEGIASRLPLQQVHHRLPAPRRAQHRGAQFGDALLGEAPQLEHLPRLWQGIRQVWALIIAIAADQQQRPADHASREPLQQDQALASDPMQVFQQNHEGPVLSPEHLTRDLREAFLRRLRVQGGRIGDLMPHQVGDVGHEGLEHARFFRCQVCGQRCPAQCPPPQVVGTASLASCLPARYLRAADQGQGAQLVEQPRLAHPTLSSHQPGAPSTRQRIVQRP